MLFTRYPCIPIFISLRLRQDAAAAASSGNHVSLHIVSMGNMEVLLLIRKFF